MLKFDFRLRTDWPTQIVGIYASGYQSGKSTVASVFEQHGYSHISFAHPGKLMLYNLLQSLGYDQNEAFDMLEGNKKAEIIPELQVTPRFLMQSLMGEWARGMVHEDIWVKAAKERIKKINPGSDGVRRIIIDDLRFFNEKAWIQSENGITIKVQRSSYRPDGHMSEGALELQSFDYIIDNDGTIDTLRQRTYNIIHEIRNAMVR